MMAVVGLFALYFAEICYHTTPRHGAPSQAARISQAQSSGVAVAPLVRPAHDLSGSG